VLALAPEDDTVVAETLAAMGVAYRAAPIERTGMNPVRDAETLRALAGIFRRHRTELVLAYGAKPVVYGTLAARIAGVPRRAALITGIGSALGGGEGVRRRVLSMVLRTLYKVALREAHVVFFQNPDDEALFRSLGLISSRNRVVRVNGSGVDLDHYAPAALAEGPPVILLVARLIRDKGVVEFSEAARIVKQTHPEVRFQILGQLDTNPSAISVEDIERWQREGILEYLGQTEDVRPYIAAAHVCVLPSYGEGTPRSVLEAMAMGRPIVATDVPGCRETVVEGINGHLVPVRDGVALAEGITRLVDDPHRLALMGRSSRDLAVERFDVHAVNRVMLEALNLGS
jgi:glycosyltransferase involved in cell wall biosynthesis